MIKKAVIFSWCACFILSSCGKTNGLVAIEKTLNLANKENVMAKLKSGAYIKIACEGTSLTYGEDIKGTDTISAGFPNGPTRAIYQYPATMLQLLNNRQFTLSVRGYPGDRTTDAITRWQDSTTADVCIIEYGTNDAYNFAAYASGKVSVSIYKAQLTQLVERRVNQGAWIIVCLSPHLQSGDEAINAYRKAAAEVARSFYADTFDIDQSKTGLTAPYSDVVHFNAEGYQNWGTDIARLVRIIE